MRKTIGSNSRQKSRMYITFVMAVTAIFTFSAWASAQDAVTPPTIVPAEAPTPEPPAVPEPEVVTEPAPDPVVATEEVIVPPAEPVVTVAPVEPTIPEPVQEVDPVETEEVPARTGGNEPGTESPTEEIIETPPAIETAVPSETATETEAPATETPTPSPTVAPATPAPTVTPSPTPEPTPIVTWSQPNPISCELHGGNAQSLALDDSATWRCQTSVAADITGDAPEDLHVLWQVGANYAGDDVQIALPEGSVVSVVTPDPAPGGTSELVTFRMNWTDGQTLTFDVTVTRTSCAVGIAQLNLHADAIMQTADPNVQMARSTDSRSAAELRTTAAPNLTAPVVTMQPVVFDPLEWDGKSWGTTHGTGVITVSNDGCATSVPHNVVVTVSSSHPAILPTVAGVTVTEGNLTANAGDGTSVATVPEGYQGNGALLVEFAISPTADMNAGEYSFVFDVTTVVAP